MSPPAQRDDWESHWRRYAASAELNPAQDYRRRCIFDELPTMSGDVRLLDVGCGQGDFARQVRARSADASILGLDMSRTGLDVAKRKVPDADFLVCDLSRPPQVARKWRGWATHAVCSEVLEHVDDPAAVLRHLAWFLAPGARIVVTVPGGPRSAYDRHIGHRVHYSPATLAALLREGGFTPQRALATGFPFFNLYRLMVIARGRKLIADVETDSHGFSQRLANLMMTIFGFLFKFNLTAGPWGWQMVAVAARTPANSDAFDSSEQPKDKVTFVRGSRP